MATLSIRSLGKTFKSNLEPAVEKFSLDVKDKEFIVFVGPSGCGKTTTLRMIAGLETVSAGEIYIDDVLVNNIEAKDRNIAMVFQNYALYPHLNIYENMAFALKMQRVAVNKDNCKSKTRKLTKGEIDQKVKDAAKILDLSHLLKRKPKALSGGEKQRAALGRAIVRDPKVFLMDEPLSNLDAQLRTKTRIELLKLHKQLASTFIYVTHDQTEAMTMGNRIVIMDKAQIQQVGTPFDIFNHPANAFVAKFIGSPAMNFFTVELVGQNNQIYAKLSVNSKDYFINLSPETQQKLTSASCLGGKVLLGIRPEHIVIEKNSTDGIPIAQSFQELMGSETYVHCKLEEESLIVRVESGTVKETDQISIGFMANKIHLFDYTKKTSLLL